jgi:hypothetical protein
MLNCFSDCVIGVRGGCECTEPESGYYIDDLGAINLIKADKVVDGVSAFNGEELLLHSQKFATKKAVSDFLGILDPKFNFNSILSSVMHKGAGAVDTGIFNYSLFLNNLSCYDPLISIEIEHINFYSFDDGVATITIIEDGFVNYDFTKFVKKGMNKIKVDVNSFAEIIEIKVEGVEIGRRQSLRNCFDCSNCVVSCDDACFTIYGKDNAKNRVTEVYFDLEVKCRCSTERFICTVRSELYLPILYGTGINFLHKVLNSDRINYYVANSKDDIQKMLLNWAGGLDVISGIKQAGEYYQQLKNAKNRVESYLKNIKSKCVTCKGVRITSDLEISQGEKYNDYEAMRKYVKY